MRKIPRLFKIIDGKVNPCEITKGTDWVLKGEGIARRKYDGTCCAIINGHYYKRRQVKSNQEPPEGFIEAQDVGGKKYGWDPVQAKDKYHMEGLNGA